VENFLIDVSLVNYMGRVHLYKHNGDGVQKMYMVQQEAPCHTKVMILFNLQTKHPLTQR